MKVTNHTKVEGCLEGTNVRDIYLNCSIEQKFISFLGERGKLILNSDIKKPFFKVIIKGKYTIKGSEGNNFVRVLLPENSDNSLINEVIELIESYV